MKRGVASVLVSVALLTAASGVLAQAPVYGPDLLPELRRAASLIPGSRPASVHVITLAPGRGPLSQMVQGGGSDSITAGYPAFQVRFPQGWIVIDPTVDRQWVKNRPSFSQAAFDSLQRALVGANLVLLTHEHPDHLAALLHSPFLAQVRPHTLLTRAQVRSLIEHPFEQDLKLDSAEAAKYLVVDYEPLMPIAPGVVLLKAPGHTPGSQMVYVHLATGPELVISGDVAWAMAGITSDRQKPAAVIEKLGEDTVAIAPQLKWLRDVSNAGVAVVVSHDDSSIQELVRRGVLKRGFDLR